MTSSRSIWLIEGISKTFPLLVRGESVTCKFSDALYLLATLPNVDVTSCKISCGSSRNTSSSNWLNDENVFIASSSFDPFDTGWLAFLCSPSGFLFATAFGSSVELCIPAFIFTSSLFNHSASLVVEEVVDAKLSGLSEQIMIPIPRTRSLSTSNRSNSFIPVFEIISQLRVSGRSLLFERLMQEPWPRNLPGNFVASLLFITLSVIFDPRTPAAAILFSTSFARPIIM
mmetsp:Transcript_8760/g.18179  ORF Transcript_8760/g.18179 Transcript_8760/m.18179 type:complete len:229 (-) Transcript_8760:254-940(-)